MLRWAQTGQRANCRIGRTDGHAYGRTEKIIFATKTFSFRPCFGCDRMMGRAKTETEGRAGEVKEWGKRSIAAPIVLIPKFLFTWLTSASSAWHWRRSGCAGQSSCSHCRCRSENLNSSSWIHCTKEITRPKRNGEAAQAANVTDLWREWVVSGKDGVREKVFYRNAPDLKP